MANIPIPQQGQPIDYQYIYQIVNNLNDLSTKVTSQFSPSIINGKDNAAESHRLNDLAVVAGYTVVSNNNSAVTVKTEKAFRYDFGVTFKYPPVVTATPYFLAGGVAGRDVSIVITDTSTSSISGYVTFNSATTANVSTGVNIIAVGIPVISA